MGARNTELTLISSGGNAMASRSWLLCGAAPAEGTLWVRKGMLARAGAAALLRLLPAQEVAHM